MRQLTRADLMRGGAIRGSSIRGNAVRGSSIRGSAIRGSAVRDSSIHASLQGKFGVEKQFHLVGRQRMSIGELLFKERNSHLVSGSTRRDMFIGGVFGLNKSEVMSKTGSNLVVRATDRLTRL